MRFSEIISEDANLKRQAAIAIAMKKAGKKPKGVAEAGMPSSVVKSKQRYAAMSDKDFHTAHKDKSEDDLKAMAWRHGYGKGSTHYVDKHKKGQQGVAEEVNPDITSGEKYFSGPTPNVRMGDFIFNASLDSGGYRDPNAKGLKITAYDPKNFRKIGWVDFIVHKDKKGNTWLESDETEVDDRYQRKGVATMMYAYAKSLGNDIKPSDLQSNSGIKMWKKWGSDAAHLVGEQGVAEEVNPEILSTKNSLPTENITMGDYEFNARIYTGELGNPGLQIRAYDPKLRQGIQQIGNADFVVHTDEKGNTWLESDDTAVRPSYYGKGVAAMMYAFAKSLGNDIKPSPYQEPPGKKMWKKWGKDAKNLVGEQGVAEGEKIGNMDADDFDDAMSRLKKLAGAGPMRTVYDPQKRVYRNMPTAQQPAQQPKKAK